MVADTEQQLTRIELEIAEATSRRDLQPLERYLTADFIGVGARGDLLTKAEILARLSLPGYDIESVRHEDIRVYPHGDCAVVVARSVMKGRYQGKDVNAEARYMRAWVRRSGRWLAVATQSTLLPAANP